MHRVVEFRVTERDREARDVRFSVITRLGASRRCADRYSQVACWRQLEVNKNSSSREKMQTEPLLARVAESCAKFHAQPSPLLLSFRGTRANSVRTKTNQCFFFGSSQQGNASRKAQSTTIVLERVRRFLATDRP